MTPYDEIRADLSTGDIVLFSGRSFGSRLIQRATRCRWSHVAMAVRVPEYDFVCLWESTTGGQVEDLRSGRVRRGVQLVPMSERVRQYEGRIAVRHRAGGPRVYTPKVIAELRAELRGRPYEESMIDLACAALEGSHGGEEDLSSLFCSELVAEAYQRLGLLPDDPPSDTYTPADFSAAAGLELLGGARLGDERLIGG